MSFIHIEDWQAAFDHLCDRLLAEVQANEQLTLELGGEQSQFIRFNRAKVRQTGMVTDGTIKLELIQGHKTATAKFPFSRDLELDTQAGLEELAALRHELPQLPDDLYIVRPENLGSSQEVYSGQLLNPEQGVEAILPAVQGLDFTGIYSAGPVVRANRNSAGQRHWFSTESFCLDYSVIAPCEKAVKATLAGANWNEQDFEKQIQQAKQQLEILARPVKVVEPGQYRAYLAPDAIAELIGMFSWGAVSESSLRQGGSALAKLREGTATLSPHFSLQEDFRRGAVPRFNHQGEVAPETLDMITEGTLANTLVNARTAKEYGLQSNGANRSESLRAAVVHPGSLAESDVLAQLDTGLYLSNLHYLNWSDRIGGRITGMTRFACFWVEKGEIIAPIQDLRFDDSLYSFFGENLEAVTQTQSFISSVDTYEARDIGGVLVPGMLFRAFMFTL